MYIEKGIGDLKGGETRDRSSRGRDAGQGMLQVSTLLFMAKLLGDGSKLNHQDVVAYC